MLWKQVTRTCTQQSRALFSPSFQESVESPSALLHRVRAYRASTTRLTLRTTVYNAHTGAKTDMNNELKLRVDYHETATDMHTTTSYAVCYSTIRPSAMRATARRAGRRAKTLTKLRSPAYRCRTACNAPGASFSLEGSTCIRAVAAAAGHLPKFPSRTKVDVRVGSGLQGLHHAKSVLVLRASGTTGFQAIRVYAQTLAPGSGRNSVP